MMEKVKRSEMRYGRTYWLKAFNYVGPASFRSCFIDPSSFVKKTNFDIPIKTPGSTTFYHYDRSKNRESLTLIDKMFEVFEI